MKVTVIGSHLCPDTLYALNRLSEAKAEKSFCQPSGLKDIPGSAAGQPRLCRYPGKWRYWDSLLCSGGRNRYAGFGCGFEIISQVSIYKSSVKAAEIP